MSNDKSRSHIIMIAFSLRRFSTKHIAITSAIANGMIRWQTVEKTSLWNR